MNRRKEEDFWPTPEQELLLKASLMTGEDAIAAWRNWVAAVDFDSLDAGSQRLLPLLYRNLIDHDVQHPIINIYKGFYRMTWYKNRLLYQQIICVLRLLESNGISAVLLKGAVLATLYYKDWALRPMYDFDMLVRQCDALKAIDILCRAGWETAASRPNGSDLLTMHACLLTNASDVQCDLHWRVIHEAGRDDDDYSFKSHTRVIEFEDLSVSVLSHTDQLFHVLVHGARWNPVAPLRWVADSMMILKNAEMEIDWHRLLQEARYRCFVIAIRKTLIYLHEVFAAPIPADIISSLVKIKPSLAERMEFRMNSCPRSIARDICYLWFLHVRTSEARGITRLIFGFPSFLGRFWKVRDDKSLAGFLICKLFKRIGNASRDLFIHRQAV